MENSAKKVENERTNTWRMLRRVWRHIKKRRKVQLLQLLALMVASGLAELVSLGALIPFLSVMSAPEQLWKNIYIRNTALRLGIMNADSLLLPATILFAITAVLAALVRLLNLWCNGRVAAGIGSDLSGEAYRRTLYQPYEAHLQRNSSEVINSITNQVFRSVEAFKATLQMATSMIVACGLLICLIWINYKVAVATAVLVGGTYGMIAGINRRELSRNSSQIKESSSELVKAVQEGLGAIRDILLDGSQELYLEIYLKADRRNRQLQVKNDFLSSFPRYVLEAMGIVGVAFLGWILIGQKGNIGEVIPLLGALALGAQRLLPVFQQGYGGWALLNGYKEDVDGLIEMLEQPIPRKQERVNPLTLKQSIRLDGVRFRYGNNQPEILRGVDLEIRKGERIGLVGTTGSGKTTMVDVLMGLLAPTGGRLIVDGQDIHDSRNPERLEAWRTVVAHVPQSVYLADSTIAENIAFGITKEKINMDWVRKAAKQAQIASFIESIDDGYENFVGERGIRLSGGQRQRIGIARALYKDAEVIVFDEATSALDDATERAVMESINGLSRELTVVIIAHRLSTLQHCDRVIEVNSRM